MSDLIEYDPDEAAIEVTEAYHIPQPEPYDPGPETRVPAAAAKHDGEYVAAIVDCAHANAIQAIEALGYQPADYAISEHEWTGRSRRSVIAVCGVPALDIEIRLDDGEIVVTPRVLTWPGLKRVAI